MTKPFTMGISDVRMEKVLMLRTAIANGTYHVSAADLAQKLICHMLGDSR